MSRTRFDFVFGLGAGCSCSRMLRERGLQYASFPLDWVGDPTLNAGVDLRLTIDVVAGGFQNWFEKANLERTTLYDSENHVSYFDRGTRLYFAHDFAPGDDFALAYSAVREKYLRRIARFKKILSAAKSALVVWVADPRGNGEVVEDDIEYSLNALRAAYPKTDFMLLVANCVPGVPPEKMRVKRGKGYECLSFDYRVVTDGPPTWDIRTELFTPILDRFAAVDYRTRAEKRANARREKARAYVKFKADSPWTYFVNRLQFKLYRHFKRRLERKGVLSSIEPSCRTGGCH